MHGAIREFSGPGIYSALGAQEAPCQEHLTRVLSFRTLSHVPFVAHITDYLLRPRGQGQEQFAPCLREREHPEWAGLWRASPKALLGGAESRRAEPTSRAPPARWLFRRQS